MGVPDKSNPEVVVRCQLLVLLVEGLKEEGFGEGRVKGEGVQRRRGLKEEGFGERGVKGGGV
jgi:hypothetical protein